MLKVLIMGPAGSGKGTVSDKIVETYQLQHISTGDMFRDEIKRETSLGREANSYITKGLLVPDDVTIRMVKKRLKRKDCQNGYILDGFPRSVPQAEAIEEIGINCVLNLTIDKQVLEDRIVYRRICKQCGAAYNLKSLPPMVEDVCDKCGGQLYQRADDSLEKLEVRLNSYENETRPVVDLYREKGVVYDIDAAQSPQQVFNQVKEVLDRIKGETQ